MKKKVKKQDSSVVLHLVCVECGHKFNVERYRKYCCYKCQRKANARQSKVRYAEMRDIILKAKGVIK